MRFSDEIIGETVTSALQQAWRETEWLTLSDANRARVWREDFEPLLAAMPDDLRARPLIRGTSFVL